VTVFLKTKKKSHKEYHMALMGMDLFFYRNKSEAHEFMHSLKGAFVKNKSAEELEEGSGNMVYPIKLVLSKKRARVLFFESDEMRIKWCAILKETSGTSDILDFYKFQSKLGEG
jgi:hypothetical protein